MKQIICDCGRIAEVRRRSNGKKLRYKHCKVCGTSLGGIESAKILEREERDDIGEFGAFYENEGAAPASEPEKEPAQSAGDWVPDSETMPEIIETAGDQIPGEKPESIPKKSGVSKVFGWGLLALGLCGLGYGASRAININGGKG